MTSDSDILMNLIIMNFGSPKLFIQIMSDQEERILDLEEQIHSLEMRVRKEK